MDRMSVDEHSELTKQKNQENQEAAAVVVETDPEAMAPPIVAAQDIKSLIQYHSKEKSPDVRGFFFYSIPHQFLH